MTTIVTGQIYMKNSIVNVHFICIREWGLQPGHGANPFHVSGFKLEFRGLKRNVSVRLPSSAVIMIRLLTRCWERDDERNAVTKHWTSRKVINTSLHPRLEWQFVFILRLEEEEEGGVRIFMEESGPQHISTSTLGPWLSCVGFPAKFDLGPNP